MATLDLSQFSQSLAAIVAKVAPSIVRVEARASRASSGVVFSDTLVLTANHALERDEHITVHTHDGRALTATLRGRDPGTDLAILELAAADALSPLTFAPADGLQVGHLVLSIARPGKTARATSGIISAFGESYRTQSNGKIDHYLESDADLRAGFSGGALVNTDGAALGIVTGGIVRGTTVAVPTKTARRVVEELASHGRVRRGYLGVGSYPLRLSPAVAARVGQSEGAVLVAVEPEGPADKGGLLQGDVLLAIDGEPIGHPAHVAAALEDKADAEVTLRVLRAGEIREFRVTAARRR
jgi:S1-C subfamily serine protease